MSFTNGFRQIFICIVLSVTVLLSSCSVASSNSTEITTTQTTTKTTTTTTKPQTTYILNTNKRSRRFHYPDCYSAKSIKDENRLEFTGTREEALARGYKPCGNCNP